MGMSFLDFSPTPHKVMYDADIPAPILTFGPMSYMVDIIPETNTIDCHVLIGNYCSIAHRVTFSIATNHNYHCVTTFPQHKIAPYTWDSSMPEPKNPFADPINRHQIVIGSDVWIGSDSFLFGGVHIGNGAVIGAGTVVAKDVPPYAIAIGNPIRIVKYRFDAETIRRLQRIKWWHWEKEQIEQYIPAFNNDMAGFLDRFDPGEPVWEEDEAYAAVRDLRADGYTVFYCIPDFGVEPAYAVWPRMIDRFLAAYTAEDRVALMLAVHEGESAQPCLAEIMERLAARGEDAPLILSHGCSAQIPFSITALKASSAYITTREYVSTLAVDFADDAGLAIRYGLDQGALLFPPV